MVDPWRIVLEVPVAKLDLFVRGDRLIGTSRHIYFSIRMPSEAESLCRRFTGVTGSTVSFDGRISNYSSPALSLGISPLAKFRDLTLDSPTSDLSAYFDPTRPDCPSRKYLDDNLDAFFDNLQRRFLFLNRDSLRHAVVQQSLSATFSNCIAALALRLVSHLLKKLQIIQEGIPDLTSVLLKRPQYLETPESKVSPSWEWPKYDFLFSRI